MGAELGDRTVVSGAWGGAAMNVPIGFATDATRRSMSRPVSLRRMGGRDAPLMRLVCVPWCGAGASVYKRLASLLPDHLEIWSVQLPGREDRFSQPCLRRMSDIVAHVTADLEGLFDRPLALFGHSMGALVAIEVARSLAARTGREPQAVIVSGQNAPEWRTREPTRWHCADEDAFVANLRALGGTPEPLLADRSLLRAFLPMLRADYEALETHAPGPQAPLGCAVIACAGRADPEIDREGLEAWRRHTSAGFSTHWFDGDHFYLASDASALAARLPDWCGGRHGPVGGQTMEIV